MYRPTAKTIEIFTEGDCWLLALELRRLTGVPLAFFNEFGCEDPDSWGHVGVLLPDGGVLDIEGKHSVNKWINRWGYFTERGYPAECPNCGAEGARCLFYSANSQDLVDDLLIDQYARFSSSPRRVARRLLDTYAPSLLQ